MLTPLFTPGSGSGDRGHDYARVAEDTKLVDVAAVDRLIAQRMQCKIQRDFDRADEVRQLPLQPLPPSPTSQL